MFGVLKCFEGLVLSQDCSPRLVGRMDQKNWYDEIVLCAQNALIVIGVIITKHGIA
jgi:hypothetical protein